MSQNDAKKYSLVRLVEHVGIDAGAACTKAVSRLATVVNPTSVKFGETPVDGVIGKPAPHTEWRINDTVYTVGAKLNGIETGSGAWYGSDGRVVSAHDAAAKALQQSPSDTGCNLNVTFVTPLDQYYDSATGKKNTLSIETQLDAFKKNVQAVNGLKNTVTKVWCLSEGVAAIVDHILNENGEVVPERKNPVPILCIDFGGSTIDVAHTHGLTVDLSMSTCVRMGISKAVQQFSKHLPSGLNEYMVRDAFNNGKLSLYGEERDLSEVKKKVVAAFAAEVLHWIKTRIVSPSNYHKIILVGGGAELLRPYLTAESLFPNLSLPKGFIHIPDAPALANARGAYKYTVRMSRTA